MKEKDKKPQNVTVGQSDSDDSDFSDFTSAAFICQTDEWILDSGYTFHVSTQRLVYHT